MVPVTTTVPLPPNVSPVDAPPRVTGAPTVSVRPEATVHACDPANAAVTGANTVRSAVAADRSNPVAPFSVRAPPVAPIVTSPVELRTWTVPRLKLVAPRVVFRFVPVESNTARSRVPNPPAGRFGFQFVRVFQSVPPLPFQT